MGNYKSLRRLRILQNNKITRQNATPRGETTMDSSEILRILSMKRGDRPKVMGHIIRQNDVIIAQNQEIIALLKGK